jgi:peptide/nickel transport system substrate-binding protein
MKKKLMAVILSIVMVLSIGLGLGGCGGGSKTGMVIGTGEFVDTLNPLTAWAMMSAEVFNLIYDPLVRYDENLESVSCLAKSWDLSDDNLTWTFHLVEANWQDGEKFTSADVKYTYELFMGDVGAKSMYNSYLSGITSITCPDDQTVVIKTSEPKANMLQNTTPILPKHIWKDIDEEDLSTYANDTPIGTGPYKFAEKGDGSLTLTLNEDYFGTKGTVPSYSFVKYKNSDSAAQALKTGEIDAALALNAAQLSQLKSEDGIDVISGEIPGFMQVSINVSDKKASTGNAILKDVEVRHALEYCIDKQKGLDMAFSGAGTVGTTIINPSDPFHWEPSASLLRGYDVKEAKQILEGAGYKDTDGDGIREDSAGNPLEFELICIADNTEDVKYGQIIKAGCAKAGIEIDCVTMDSGALTDKLLAHDYDLFIWGWGADVDPGAILDILTTDYGNEPDWSNAEYDKLFLKQAVTMDQDKRIEIVQKMQQIVYEEAPYIVLLYDNSIQAVRSDKWEGYVQVPENGCYFLNLSIVNYMNMHSK